MQALSNMKKIKINNQLGDGTLVCLDSIRIIYRVVLLITPDPMDYIHHAFVLILQE